MDVDAGDSAAATQPKPPSSDPWGNLQGSYTVAPSVDVPAAPPSTGRPSRPPPPPGRARLTQQARGHLASVQTCPLCLKTNGDGHTQGKKHLEREEEHVTLDLWLGQTKLGLRILQPVSDRGVLFPAVDQAGPRFPGMAKQLMLDHWGWNLPNLVNAARSVWQRTGVKWGKRTYPWPPSVQIELAIVNYSGSGKYHDTNRVVPWRALDGNHSFQGALPTHNSWWPVTMVWIPGAFDGPSLTHWVQDGTGGWKCYIVCVYQWQWPEPAAWGANVQPFTRLAIEA